MNKLATKIEMFANAAIIVVAILLSLILIKNHLLSNPNQVSVSDTSPSETITKHGRSITFPDINWRESKYSLVLALSTTCSYCTESALFYKKLVQDEKKSASLQSFPSR